MNSQSWSFGANWRFFWKSSQRWSQGSLEVKKWKRILKFYQCTCHFSFNKKKKQRHENAHHLEQSVQSLSLERKYLCLDMYTKIPKVYTPSPLSLYLKTMVCALIGARYTCPWLDATWFGAFRWPKCDSLWSFISWLSL